MSRLFIHGSEVEIIQRKASGLYTIDVCTSDEILCSENESESKAREHLATAQAAGDPRRIVACDYGPTPDELGITVSVFYATSVL